MRKSRLELQTSISLEVDESSTSVPGTREEPGAVRGKFQLNPSCRKAQRVAVAYFAAKDAARLAGRRLSGLCRRLSRLASETAGPDGNTWSLEDIPGIQAGQRGTMNLEVWLKGAEIGFRDGV